MTACAVAVKSAANQFATATELLLGYRNTSAKKAARAKELAEFRTAPGAVRRRSRAPGPGCVAAALCGGGSCTPSAAFWGST